MLKEGGDEPVDCGLASDSKPGTATGTQRHKKGFLAVVEP